MNTTQNKLVQCPHCDSFGKFSDFSKHMELNHPNGATVKYPDAQREINSLISIEQIYDNEMESRSEKY